MTTNDGAGEDDSFRKAVLFIYRNLEQPLSLERVAAAAGISTATLKRVFAQRLGRPPGALVRRLKMEVALRTLQDRDQSVLETALAAGFEDHAAFSRSFRRSFGFAPSAARNRVNLTLDLAAVALEEPDFVDLRPLSIQSVITQGYYFDCARRAWQALDQRLRAAPAEAREGCLYVGLALDDPHTGAAEDQVRFVAGVLDLPVDLDLSPHTVEGGRFARFRYRGRTASIGLAYHHIFGPWRATAPVTIRPQPAPVLLFADLPTGQGDEEIMICVPIAQR